MATTKALDEDGVVLLASDIKTLSDATYPSNAAIASAYDATAAYSVGDYCLRNGLLYKCNTAIATGGEAWTAAHWTLTNVVSNFGASADILHVGASAPSSPDAQIWLDTDEPGMSAVLSVNGATGTVVLDADDVGAMTEWDLLWENASPTSAFSAQTISLNLSNYQFVLIGINGWEDDETITYQINRKGDNAAHIQFRNAQNTSTSAVFQRNITVANSGVAFTDCKGKANITNNTVATSNSGLVPAIIYGIKGADI